MVCSFLAFFLVIVVVVIRGNQRVRLISLIGILLEELAVWVGHELVLAERETDRVLLDPGLFTLESLRLIRRGLHLNLAMVVPEFVVRDDEGVHLACILDAVGVIVVLGRSLDHDPFLCHLYQD